MSGPTDGNGNCGASEHSPRTSSPGTREKEEEEIDHRVKQNRGVVCAWCARGASHGGCRCWWCTRVCAGMGLGGCSPASRAAVRRGPALWSERVLLLWERGQRGTPGVNGGARNRMHMTTASSLEPGDLLEREVIPAPNQPPRAHGLNWRIPDGPRECPSLWSARENTSKVFRDGCHSPASS